VGVAAHQAHGRLPAAAVRRELELWCIEVGRIVAETVKLRRVGFGDAQEPDDDSALSRSGLRGGVFGSQDNRVQPRPQTAHHPLLPRPLHLPIHCRGERYSLSQ